MWRCAVWLSGGCVKGSNESWIFRGGWCQFMEDFEYSQEEDYLAAQNLTKTISEPLYVIQDIYVESQMTSNVAK